MSSEPEKSKGRTELAASLGVSRQAVWLWEKAGELPSPDVRVGRRLKFSPESQAIAAALAARAIEKIAGTSRRRAERDAAALRGRRDRERAVVALRLEKANSVVAAVQAEYDALEAVAV